MNLRNFRKTIYRTLGISQERVMVTFYTHENISFPITLIQIALVEYFVVKTLTLNVYMRCFTQIQCKEYYLDGEGNSCFWRNLGQYTCTFTLMHDSEENLKIWSTKKKNILPSGNSHYDFSWVIISLLKHIFDSIYSLFLYN